MNCDTAASFCKALDGKEIGFSLVGLLNKFLLTGCRNNTGFVNCLLIGNAAIYAIFSLLSESSYY